MWIYQTLKKGENFLRNEILMMDQGWGKKSNSYEKLYTI